MVSSLDQLKAAGTVSSNNQTSFFAYSAGSWQANLSLVLYVTISHLTAPRQLKLLKKHFVVTYSLI